MAKDDNKKVIVSPHAFVSMTTHALEHYTCVVHGILVGTHSDKGVQVSDAFPVCHESPTRPLIETALALVQARIMDTKETIVGWYSAPELLPSDDDEEDRPGPIELRVVANLSSKEKEPVLIILQNKAINQLAKGLGKFSAVSAIKAFGKDFGQQWMEPPLSIAV